MAEPDNAKFTLATSFQVGEANKLSRGAPNEDGQLSAYKLKFLVSLFSGGVAAMAGATVACPFDVIKTRLQSSHTYLPPKSEVAHSRAKERCLGSRIERIQYISSLKSLSSSLMTHNSHRINGGGSSTLSSINIKNVPSSIFYFNSFGLKNPHCLPSGVLQILKSSVCNEGLSSLFKGLLPSFAAVVPAKAVYFGFYSMFKDVYSPMLALDTHSNILCASLSAGFIQSSLISPIFMVRTRLQLSTRKMSVMKVVSEIYHSHGIKGFFRGLTATYFGLSETAIHFLLYENLKWFLKRNKHLTADIDVKNSALVGLSAIVSRVFATTIAYPHEVVRTRMRQVDANYAGLLHCVREIYSKERWSGFYRGLEVELMKKVPNIAVVFIVYESLMTYFSNHSLPFLAT